MHIGTRIKSLMKSQGVTTKKMAVYCEVSPGAVSNWFSTGRISKEKLALAAKLLNVSTDELISGYTLDDGHRNVLVKPTTQDRRKPTHTIPSLEDACNTLARHFEGMPKEDMDNAARWLSGLVYQPSSAPHVIGVLTEMVVTPRKSSLEKSTGT